MELPIGMKETTLIRFCGDDKLSYGKPGESWHTVLDVDYDSILDILLVRLYLDGRVYEPAEVMLIHPQGMELTDYGFRVASADFASFTTASSYWHIMRAGEDMVRTSENLGVPSTRLIQPGGYMLELDGWDRKSGHRHPGRYECPPIVELSSPAGAGIPV